MSANQRKKYKAMLLALCVVLAFGIVQIVRSANQPEQEDPVPSATGEAELPTESAVPVETVTASVTESDTSDGTEEETDGETTEEQETEEETTESVVPAYVSTDGRMHMDKGHIYIRINHSKDIPIRLTGGLARSQIEWSTDDDSVVDITNGTVTGLTRGECTITARFEDDVLEIPVTVRELWVEDGCTFVDGILIANKSYSLPEDYDPGTLDITREAFEMLMEDAAAEGMNIYESSSYRSYNYQVTVYSSMVSGYSKSYADAYSARPGHSEHQTGYTIDCNTIDDDFGTTAEGKWLASHCHEYGFIIRYPRGKEDITGYAYESWHIRYVGVEHATKIYEQGLTLEEYLDIDSVYPDTEQEEDGEDVPEDEEE